jgi:YHS domain-containing protein
MKKLIGALLIIAAGCNQPQQAAPEKKMETISAIKDTAAASLAKLSFDSKKDLSCGMPITAGISDTAHYKSKLYGFCSAECKADFLKDPETHLAANK